MKRFLMLMAIAVSVLAGCGGGDSPTSPNSNNSNEDFVKVVSVTPAHESAGQEGLVELRVDFDRPVSEIVAVLLPEGLGFSNDDWLLRSDDGTSWSKQLNVRSGKEYQFIVIEALGEDGNRIENPVMTVFTSRATLPQGKISGKVTAPSTISPMGTLIMAYDANQWTGFDSVFDPDVLTAFGYIDDASGEYEVPYLNNGNYYMMALKYNFEEGEDGVVQVEDVFLGIYGQWAAVPQFEKISLPQDGLFDEADIQIFLR